MRHAAQPALFNPEFCSNLGRRWVPFCLFSGRETRTRHGRTSVRQDIISSLPPANPVGTHRTSLYLQRTQEGLCRTGVCQQVQAISLIQDCVLLYLFSHLALSASSKLAELNGKRRALSKRIPSHAKACICPLQGAISLGTSSGSSAKCLHLTWTKDELDPGAGTPPPKRQQDGCVLWAQQQPGGKSGEQSWRWKSQLVNQQTVSNRELERKANMKLQMSKGQFLFHANFAQLQSYHAHKHLLF